MGRYRAQMHPARRGRDLGAGGGGAGGPRTRRAARPFLGVLFKCCHVYNRAYLTDDGSAYIGCCPKCGAQVTFRVDPTGSKARFWSAE